MRKVFIIKLELLLIVPVILDSTEGHIAHKVPGVKEGQSAFVLGCNIPGRVIKISYIV